MAYVINPKEHESIVTHWIALYVNGENITYFDSSGVEHIPKRIISQEISIDKYLYINIYILMFEYFCIGFIYFMIQGKSLLGKNLFSSNEYEKNDKIIPEYFQ